MTGTAQVLGSLIAAGAASGDGSWLGVFKYVVAGLAALASPFVLQEISEYVIVALKVPFFAKPFVPKVLAAIVAGILNWTGLDPQTSAASGVALMGLVKLANETPWALDLEKTVTGLLTPASPGVASLVAAAQTVASTHANLQANPTQANAVAQHANAVSNLSSVVASLSKALLVILMLGLAVGARAGVTFGQVSLSPTAAPMVVSVQPFISGSFFKVSGQGVLTDENDALAGMTALANWGPYNIGLAAAVDRDMTDAVTYLAGGLIAGVNPYGEVALLWRYGGAVLTYTMPIGVGAQTTP